MEFDDFINIETTNLKGKTIIKVDDTYIDSFDGQEIDYTSPIHSDDDGSGWEGEDSEEEPSEVVSKMVKDICHNGNGNDNGDDNGNGDDDNEIYVPKHKPDMVVMEDNEIMAGIKKNIIENKGNAIHLGGE